MAEWRLAVDDLEALALGAGILGTGGGGNVYVAKLWIRELIAGGRAIRVVDPEDLADDALVVGTGGIGAPTVSFEKLRRGDEETRAVRALEMRLGRRFDAVVPVEAGGANAMRPMAVAALTGLPVVDADGMGRAFPELQMTTFHIYGAAATPAAIADEKGNVTVWTEPIDARELERLARARCIEMGGTAGMADPVLTGAALKRTAIPRTLSLARRVGAAVLGARERKEDPVAALLRIADGRLLLRGKIVDVERRTAAGFARGTVRVAGTGTDALAIDFQNENLVARRDGAVVASVPDLICIVQTEDAEPIGTELLRYGYRVSVVVLPAPRLLTTPAALAVVGPRAFGYDVDWVAT
ncbi:MAG TPA: DUF917 domain-containing protein [Candidatus Limnocylindria bacterium]|nr:DUF917 domain-containing protein [Candidatus Limnocylindria bacterium]